MREFPEFQIMIAAVQTETAKTCEVELTEEYARAMAEVGGVTIVPPGRRPMKGFDPTKPISFVDFCAKLTERQQEAFRRTDIWKHKGRRVEIDRETGRKVWSWVGEKGTPFDHTLIEVEKATWLD